MMAVILNAQQIIAMYISISSKKTKIASRKLKIGTAIRNTYMARFHTQWYFLFDSDIMKSARAQIKLLPCNSQVMVISIKLYAQQRFIPNIINKINGKNLTINTSNPFICLVGILLFVSIQCPIGHKSAVTRSDSLALLRKAFEIDFLRNILVHSCRCHISPP